MKAWRGCSDFRAVRGGSLVVAMACGMSWGCGTPRADVVAAWVDRIVDEQNTRGFRVYDRGEILEFSIDHGREPATSTLVDVAVAFDNKGGGAAWADRDKTMVIDLVRGRAQVFATDTETDDADPAALEVDYTRAGDAVLRRVSDGLELMPLAGTRTVRLPLPPQWRTLALPLFASDAPVLAWIDVTPEDGGPELWLYPSESPSVWGPTDRPRRLSSGPMPRRDFIPEDADPWRVGEAWCPERVCIAPEGTSLTAMAPERCTVLWWRPDPDPQQPALVTRVRLDPEQCGADGQGELTLFAQIEDDVALLDDEGRIYVADLHTGALEVGAKPALARSVAFSAMDGHAVVIVTSDLQVVRVDADGIRRLSTAHASCPFDDITRRSLDAGVLISPSGLWVLGWCRGDGTVVDASAGAIFRLSPLGFETFPGVAMAGLGIDDQGNALTYSLNAEGVPRGLFVLSGDGTIHRIDDLEPEPLGLPPLGARRFPHFLVADPVLAISQ